MRINISQGLAQYEFNETHEQYKILEIFFNRIHKIVFQENHIHKFDGPLQLELILNTITEELDIHIIFFYCEERNAFLIEYLPADLHLLEQIVKIFSREYRFNAGAYIE